MQHAVDVILNNRENVLCVLEVTTVADSNHIRIKYRMKSRLVHPNKYKGSNGTNAYSQ